MIVNKRQIGVTVGVLIICTAVCIQAQNHPYVQIGGGPTPLTPAQRATLNRIGQLDKSAAAELDRDHYAKAEADARHSMSLGHDSGVALELFAQSLNAQGKTQEALKAYRQIYHQGGHFPRNLLPYAQLLLETGHVSQAVVVYNESLYSLDFGNLVKANSHFSPGKANRTQLASAIHVAQGLTYASSDSWGGSSQVEKAMDEFDQALRLQPDSALANYYYGYGWQKLPTTEKLKAQTAAKAKASLMIAAASGSDDIKKAAADSLRTFKYNL